MPDRNRPTGVDYYAFDTIFASGTESPGNPRVVDWLTHADQGVRFAILKARHAQFVGGHPPWFALNYPLVKNAGLLRAPYHWLDPCRIQLPANVDAVNSSNWNNAALFPIIGNPLDFVLQQANAFCDQILAEGWGEPGDLPPAVDIEHSPFMTAAGDRVDALFVDAAGRQIFVGPNGNPSGVVVAGGAPGGQVLVDNAGVQLGQVHTNAAGLPFEMVNAAGQIIPLHRKRENSDERFADLWRRVPAPIGCVVVWLAQVERRLAAAVPGRPVKPILYTANTWREVLQSPTDNGGRGWDVNHNGVAYHVDNFADYPYWIADYRPLTARNEMDRLFPATWATVGRTFIWQFTGDPDRNAVMRIDAVAPGAGASTRTVTVTEIDGQPGQPADGLTFIESLAGITRPAAPRVLTRISQPPIDPDPARSFNVLLIGQGFDAAEFLAIAQRVWSDPANLRSVTDTDPFGVLRNRSRVACYADDGTGVFLRMRQTPSPMADDALSIPPDAAAVLRDYLPLLTIVGDDGRVTTADKVWLEQRRQVGATGGLIVILRNGRLPARNQPAVLPQQRPAELYQLDPSENYPVPVVAVNVTWNDELWPLPIVRALAQNLGGLRDEFELPGDRFDHPAIELVQPAAPNLLFVDKATRDGLAAGGAVPADIVQRVINEWRLPAGTAIDFFANGAAPGALGGVHLVEGGDGYRHQVLRCDFDCLMRRMPVTVAASVIAAGGRTIRVDGVRFCRVCREWLEAVLRGTQQVRAGESIRLDTQRIGYDWVSWHAREQPAAGFDPARNFNRVHTMPVPADEPKWSMSVTYNPAAATLPDLFQIRDVRLAQRPGDPYARAVDVVRSIRFDDLSVSFTRRAVGGGPFIPESIRLDPAAALANRLDPPRLELASDGGADRAYQIGARLTLAWPVIRSWHATAAERVRDVRLFTVEAVLGLVLTGEQDVDPSFPVRGCRILPQFALRIRRNSGLVTTGRAAVRGGVAANVTQLKGSVAIEAVNAIAPDPTLDPKLAPIATGRLGATLVCGSNSAMGDSAMAPVANNLLLPATGRKLAGLHVNGADPAARLRPFTIGPPAWSWRYDYVRTLVAARTVVAGSYHLSEPKGAADPAATRDHNFTWPSGSAFTLNVHKFGRQGDYDALYIHPIDTTANPVLELPVSGDLGLVLLMRQGASESTNTFGLPRLGWGPGRLDAGAHTSVGAPLVPPNQHVDLTVEKLADGVVKTIYAATADDFGANEWQVFLEQGLALGYRYDARGGGAMQWLRDVASLAGVPAATLQALATALADVAHPAALDLQVRSLFRALHAGARFYDQAVDGIKVQQAPETGDIPGAEVL